MPKRPFYTNLYFQVLVAIAIGVVLGVVSPERAAAMKPLGDGFIKLVKMLIAPDRLHDGRGRHRADGRR